MAWGALVVVVLAGTSCAGEEGAQDADGDGWTVEDGDCDDGDERVHPGAAETWYDGVDQDCDGGSDHDQDGDGRDALTSGGTDCWDEPSSTPEGTATLNGFTPEIEAKDVHPGAQERWYDGVDALAAGDGDFDAHRDGHQTPAYPTDGFGAFGEDCDDGDATVAPGAAELCDGQDNDCDGHLPVEETDGDGDDHVECAGDPGGWDGFGSMGFEDCDDADDSVYPGARERCDGLDNDCDAVLPAEESDEDGDGHVACVVDRWGWDGDPIAGGSDCDDGESRAYPGAGETCGDGIVNDCGSTEEEAIDACALAGTMSLAEADGRLTGERQGGEAGTAVAPAGDLDGDGFADVLVGAPEEGEGVAYVFHGPLGGEVLTGDAEAQLVGQSSGDRAGLAVAGAGDIDQDGCPDLLVGAPRVDDAARGAGAAYLVYGPASGEHALSRRGLGLHGASSGDGAGVSVAGAGDVDGDGFDDLLVGAPLAVAGLLGAPNHQRGPRGGCGRG